MSNQTEQALDERADTAAASRADDLRRAAAELTAMAQDGRALDAPDRDALFTAAAAIHAAVDAPGGKAAAGFTPLPYETPFDLWKAFRGGARFVLHYHGKTYDVTRMEPRERVVYVQPPGLPVKVLPNGKSAEGDNGTIWLAAKPIAAVVASEQLLLAVDHAMRHGWPAEALRHIAGVRQADVQRAAAGTGTANASRALAAAAWTFERADSPNVVRIRLPDGSSVSVAAGDPRMGNAEFILHALITDLLDADQASVPSVSSRWSE